MDLRFGITFHVYPVPWSIEISGLYFVFFHLYFVVLIMSEADSFIESQNLAPWTLWDTLMPIKLFKTIVVSIITIILGLILLRALRALINKWWRADRTPWNVTYLFNLSSLPRSYMRLLTSREIAVRPWDIAWVKIVSRASIFGIDMDRRRGVWI